MAILTSKNGSADIEQIVAFDTQAMGGQAGSMMSGGMTQAKESLQQEGFSVSDYSEGGFTGVKASKHVANSADLASALSPLSSAGQGPSGDFSDLASGLKVQKSFFATTFKLDSSIDMSMPTDMQVPGGGNMSRQMQMASSMLDMKFSLTLPVKPRNSNAPATSNGGRTLEWPLKMGSANPISVVAVIPNYSNIGMTAAVVLLLALVIIVATRRRRTPPVRKTPERAVEKKPAEKTPVDAEVEGTQEEAKTDS